MYTACVASVGKGLGLPVPFKCDVIFRGNCSAARVSAEFVGGGGGLVKKNPARVATTVDAVVKCDPWARRLLVKCYYYYSLEGGGFHRNTVQIQRRWGSAIGFHPESQKERQRATASIGERREKGGMRYSSAAVKKMAEVASPKHPVTEVTSVMTEPGAAVKATKGVDDGQGKTWASTWRQYLRWSPTSKEEIVAAEERLLNTLVKTPYTQEQVNIGAGPPGSAVRWFRSVSDKPRFINTITFDKVGPDAPTLVMVHGYGAAQGFFFRNYDALAERFRILAIDQIGWGGSSRPDFTCKSTEETESWFVDSLEEWRKAKGLDKFILLGHSLGGYVCSRYALKHPEHVEHLLLVGAAGFTEQGSERLTEFRTTWKGVIANAIWESNFTPQKIVRTLGPWGPQLVRRYTGARFGTHASGLILQDEEARLLSDYIFHTLAARPSGELCLKYIFSFGALARLPLTKSAPDWKVQTSFIYGTEDWMDWRGAQKAREDMKVPTEIIRVPQGGHFVFMDNPEGFHSAVFYACRKFLSKPGDSSLERPSEGLIIPPRGGTGSSSQKVQDVS